MNLLKRYPLLLFFCCLVVVSLCYWPLWFHPMKHDAVNCFFPIHYYLSECLQSGVWPLWNPFMDLGLPYHADMQAAVHYFPSWIIAAALPYKMWVYHLEFLLHLALGGLGMFFFIRHFKIKWEIALAFGLFYALSGHFLSNAQHQSWVVSTAYLPFVWAFVLRFFQRPCLYYALGLAVSNSLMLTGGYPAFLVLNTYAIGIYFLFNFPAKQWKDFLLWGAIAIVIFACISMGYLYSSWDVWSHLARAEGMTYEAANMNPYSPQSLLGLFNPHLLVREIEFFSSDSAMTNVYQGILITLLLVFSVFARIKFKKRIFVLLSFLFLLLAFGDYFVLRRWTFWMPFMDLFRHIGIFRVFSILFIYPFLAFAFQQLSEHPVKQKSFKIVLFSLIGIYSFYLLSGLIFGREFLSWHLIVGSTAIQLVFLVLFLGIIYFNKNNNFPIKRLLLLNVLNLLVLHQFNIPENVVHERSLSEFQQVLDQAPNGFQADVYQNDEMLNYNNYGNKSTVPMYYNWSVIAKQFAHDQYYPFVLKKKAELTKQPDYWTILKAPLLSAVGDTTLQTVLLNYHPNYYKFQINSPEAKQVKLRFMQTNYKHWKLYLNDKPLVHDEHPALVELDDAKLNAGNNELVIRYHSSAVIWTMSIGLISSLISTGLLFVLYFRRKLGNSLLR